MSKPKVNFTTMAESHPLPKQYIQVLKLENMKLKREIEELMTLRPEKKDDIEEKFKGKLTKVRSSSKFKKSIQVLSPDHGPEQKENLRMKTEEQPPIKLSQNKADSCKKKINIAVESVQSQVMYPPTPKRLTDKKVKNQYLTLMVHAQNSQTSLMISGKKSSVGKEKVKRRSIYEAQNEFKKEEIRKMKESREYNKERSKKLMNIVYMQE